VRGQSAADVRFEVQKDTEAICDGARELNVAAPTLTLPVVAVADAPRSLAPPARGRLFRNTFKEDFVSSYADSLCFRKWMSGIYRQAAP